MDVGQFSLACSDLYAPGLTPGGFFERGFQFLRRLVGCEFIACGVLDVRTRRLDIGFDLHHPDFRRTIPAFGQLMGLYPLYNFDPSTHGGRPFRRSQFFSARRFRDLAMYEEVYRPLGIDNHCALHVPSSRPGEVIFFGLERAGGPDFSDEELALLGHAQPLLASARALACAPAGEALGDVVEIELLIRAGLTPREAETLFWITEGKSNAEIAVILGIRLYTVKEYVASIFDKAGTCNRHAAIVWAGRACRRLRRAENPPPGFAGIPAEIAA